jgi:WD40 repeat protein
LLTSVSFSSDGKTLRTSDIEGNIGFWDVASGGKSISPLRPSRRDLHFSQVLTPLGSHIATPIYVSRDGNRAAAIGGDKHIYLWHPATGEIIHDIGELLAGEPITTMQRLALSAEGSMLAATHQDGTLRLWDATTGRQIGRFGEKRATNKPDFYFPVFSADSKVLAAVARHDGTIRLWDVQTKQEIRRLKARFKNISTLTLSPDGSMLISMSSGPSARPGDLSGLYQLWNVTTGEELSQFQDQQLGWTTFDGWAFSPDGKTLAATRNDVICLWEVATGRERRRFEGHRGMVWCLAFSKDGRLLASGGCDNTALVWDVTSLPEGDSLPAQRQVLWDALASPDAARAYKAICSLIADRSSVSFLQQHLHAVAIPDRARIARLVADLDSDRFAVREDATRELENWGEQAEPALRKALDRRPSLEARRRIDQLLQSLRGPVTNPKRLQALRSIEVLEHIGTSEARQVLETLAGGTPEARVTREAKMASERLASSRR